jgi:hypothetical protein
VDCGGSTMHPGNQRCRACHNARRTAGLHATEHPTALDIAWAAGIFEGEGSCYRSPNSSTARCRVAQNDRWLLDRLRAMFGGSVQVLAQVGSGLNRKAVAHGWHISGERARGFLMTIYVFLSPRRKEQVRRALGLLVDAG